ESRHASTFPLWVGKKPKLHKPSQHIGKLSQHFSLAGHIEWAPISAIIGGNQRTWFVEVCPLSGVKQTWLLRSEMSAFDPKRTSVWMALAALHIVIWRRIPGFDTGFIWKSVQRYLPA